MWVVARRPMPRDGRARGFTEVIAMPWSWAHVVYPECLSSSFGRSVFSVFIFVRFVVLVVEVSVGDEEVCCRFFGDMLEKCGVGLMVDAVV